MFDLGWTELLVVAAVAIVVVGPKDLPRMLRTFGQTVGKLRRMAGEFQSTFNDALREAEKQADIDDMRKSVEKAGNFDPLGDIKKSIEPVNKAADEMHETVNAPISANGRAPDGSPGRGPSKEPAASSAPAEPAPAVESKPMAAAPETPTAADKPAAPAASSKADGGAQAPAAKPARAKPPAAKSTAKSTTTKTKTAASKSSAAKPAAKSAKTATAPAGGDATEAGGKS